MKGIPPQSEVRVLVRSTESTRGRESEVQRWPAPNKTHADLILSRRELYTAEETGCYSMVVIRRLHLKRDWQRDFGCITSKPSLIRLWKGCRLYVPWVGPKHLATLIAKPAARRFIFVPAIVLL